MIKSIKSKVEIEAFLDDDITAKELDELKEKIKTIGGVKKITYISKEKAAEIFEEEFGKEMLEIFEVNPLPASLKINLYEEYKTTDRLNKIKKQLSGYPKVQDIIYPEKNLEIIEKNTSGILFLNLVILIIITISSIFLVSNTIRLVISSKRKFIETLTLLGATKAFIRTPFIIEGFIQGFLGGLFSVVLLYFLYLYFTAKFSQNELRLDFIGSEYLIYLILIGIFLGILGSTISVRRYLKAHLHYK
jgi:cell division transport system permease protein